MPVHAPQVELQRGIRVLERSGPVIPAGPVRLHLEAVLVGQTDDGLHLFREPGSTTAAGRGM